MFNLGIFLLIIIAFIFVALWLKSTTHVSWWAQELPTVDEMEEGRKNLEANGNEVDFIVSHCCSSSTQVFLGGGLFRPDRLTDYFEGIRQRVKFKKWFFGHYHDNRNVNAEEILVYEQIVRIS